MRLTNGDSKVSWTGRAGLIGLIGLSVMAMPAHAAPPKITVDKTAAPASRPAPGGSFEFTVVITNTDTGNNASSAQITNLVDDVYGNLDGRGSCDIGAVLAPAPNPNSTYTCSFSGNFTGAAGDKQTDTVTATVRDPSSPSDTSSAFGKATVSLTAGGGPTCGPVPVTILGTPGADTLVGTAGVDVISGLGGNDEISGRGGDDVACGGSGKDLLRGNGGRDLLRGAGANDILRGGPANDELLGGSGNDRLRGGTGKDVCRGGSGTDRASSCATVRSVP